MRSRKSDENDTYKAELGVETKDCNKGKVFWPNQMRDEGQIKFEVGVVKLERIRQ